MRRFIVISLILLCLTAMLACSPAPTPASSLQTSPFAATGDGYVFTVKNHAIRMHDLMPPIVTALGQPRGISETPSCAFQGMDRMYDYGSFVITTYTLNKEEKTLKVDLRDDTVETAEHVVIGSSAADVKAAYGDPVKTVNESMIYEKGNTRLTFILKDNTVSSIQYDAILD